MAARDEGRSLEAEKRRRAARDEPFGFEADGRGGFRVLSGSGNTYHVAAELPGQPGGCSCPDFGSGRAGTCKHLEAVRLFRAGEKPSVTPPVRSRPGAGLRFSPRGGEVLVFDVETQRAFDEVQERRPELLGLSLAVVYAYGTDRFDVYLEADATVLIDRLVAADLVIGFNQDRFDLAVLRPYARGPLDGVRSFDLLQDLTGILGHRVALDGCCRTTLGAAKSADGLQAIAWYREGRFDLIERYCRDDVRLTRDLFDHGRARGHVWIESRGERGVPHARRVEVRWSAEGLPPIATTLPAEHRAAV